MWGVECGLRGLGLSQVLPLILVGAVGMMGRMDRTFLEAGGGGRCCVLGDGGGVLTPGLGQGGPGARGARVQGGPGPVLTHAVWQPMSIAFSSP